MKPFCLCLLLLVQQFLKGQTISFSVDNKCQSNILLNGEKLRHNGVYKMPLTGSALRFESIAIPAGKNVLVNLTSTDGRVNLRLDSKFFGMVNSFSTDEKLKATVNNKRIDLSREFQLTIGCDNGSGSVTSCTFQPEAQKPPSGSNGETIRVLNRSSIEEADKSQLKNTVANPGSIIYDALYLSGLPADVDAAQFTRILQYYFGPDAELTNAVALVSNNNYLRSIINEEYIKKLDREKVEDKAETGGLATIFSTLTSSIGGLDVTTIADGAAKFLVKRARQELGIAFFKRLKDTLQKAADLRTVFPQTVALLDVIDDDIYDYEKYIQNLRESFKKDLNAVHRNLPGIIEHHPDFFNTYPAVKSSLLSGCYIAQKLEDQTHPGDILANYPLEYLALFNNNNYTGALQTIQLLSASLRDPSAEEEGNYWVDVKTIRALVNNKTAFQLYLGLLLQEAKTKYAGVLYKDHDFATMLNSAATDFSTGFAVYNSYRNYVLRFGEKVDALNKMIKQYNKENTSDSAVLEKYAKYFRISVELIEYCTEATTLPVIKDELKIDLHQLFGKYFQLSYKVCDLVVDINRKNYSSVVNQAVSIYSLVTEKAPALDSMIQVSANKPGKATAQSLAFSSTVKNLIRYGSFIATVATAKNSDEVAQAIEAAALPVGSARIKRVSLFNVSLNAYAGLFFGIEKIQGLDKGRSPKAFGVTAPVGVAISWGSAPFKEFSTSVFLSLVDLGAVAAFRFKDDETEQIPSIQLKHIFSPGAFLSFGFPRSPLSLSFGAQAGPNLRKVKVTGNDFDDNFYWRFSTSLAVDIPLFNFHTKTK